MVIVLIAARYKKLLEWINNRNYEGIKAIYKIKNVGPKVFLYIDTSLDLKNIIKTFKKSISEQGGMAYVYEFYGIYNEKIDYNAYISNKTKDTMRYYQTKIKDLMDKELHDFLLKNNIDNDSD